MKSLPQRRHRLLASRGRGWHRFFFLMPFEAACWTISSSLSRQAITLLLFFWRAASGRVSELHTAGRARTDSFRREDGNGLRQERQSGCSAEEGYWETAHTHSYTSRLHRKDSISRHEWPHFFVWAGQRVKEHLCSCSINKSLHLRPGSKYEQQTSKWLTDGLKQWTRELGCKSLNQSQP